MTVDIEFNRVPHEKRITGQRDAASVRGTLSDNDDDIDDGGARLSRRTGSPRPSPASGASPAGGGDAIGNNQE
jgi:hypothetical protein